MRFERECIFLPFIADFAKRLTRHILALSIAQADYQLTFAFGIDGAYIFFTRDNVLRSLEDAGLGLACRHLLRIAHVHGIVLNQTVLAAIAEGRPLLCHSRYADIARRALKEHLTVG